MGWLPLCLLLHGHGGSQHWLCCWLWSLPRSNCYHHQCELFVWDNPGGGQCWCIDSSMRAVGNARCTDRQTDSARTMNVGTSSFFLLHSHSLLSQLGPDDMWGHYRYYYGSEVNTSSSSNRNYYDSDSDAYIAQNTSYLFGWLLWLLAFCGEWHGDTDHAYMHIHSYTRTHTRTHTGMHIRTYTLKARLSQ